MSERGRIRIELNLATALLFIAALSLATMTAMAQIEGAAVAAKTVAGMNATELMALIALLALGLCGYLIRLLFGRLLTALDNNTKANASVSQLLAERPCIRNPKND